MQDHLYLLTVVQGYINWNVDSDIFIIPFINHPIKWYGIFWLIGIAASYNVIKRVLSKDGKSTDFLDQLTLYIITGTIIGARLGHVLFYDPQYYLANPLKIIAIWEGGLASHGGGIGILVAIALFAKKNNISFLWMADRVALVVPLAGGCIRLGNLMNSEMIGKPTDVPWAFIFTKIDSIPRHPAQLYEAIFCFLLFAAMIVSYKKDSFKNKNGKSFGLLLTVLFSFRFIDEFFKINQEAFEDTMAINMGQILSIPFIIIGLYLLIFNHKVNTGK